MFKNLQIEGYRCFESLRVEGLKRVNLFVGANNAGKTSLLEAVEVLATGNPSALQQAANRRNEVVFVQTPGLIGPQIQPVANTRYAFRGRNPDLGSQFRIAGESDAGALVVEATMRELDPAERTAFNASRGLQWASTSGLNALVPIGANLPALVLGAFDSLRAQGPFFGLRTGTIDPLQLASAWSMAATRVDDEQLVLQCARAVEPTIESVANLGVNASMLYVSLKDVNERVPLGNLGEGVTRMFTMGCGMVLAKHGVMIVDEIDTGLHVGVMEKMWTLVFETAQKLDVQVFATTHSQDCLRGLANVLEHHADFKEQVTLHRLDKGRAKTIRDDGDEIILALDGGIEVR